MNEALSRFVDVVRRAWRVVAAITLLCVGGSALFLLSAPPQYESTALVLVSTPRDNEGTAYRGDEYSRQRRSTYAVLGASPELAQRVVDDVGLNVSPEELISGTTILSVPDTVLLAITTTGTAPSQAQSIAQAYVEELTRSVAALEAVPGGLTPRAELILVQPPTYDPAPAGLAAWMILGAAGAGGLFLSSFVVVVASLLDGRVRTPEDAVEATGAPVLATFDFAVGDGPEGAAASIGESARKLRAAIDYMQMQSPRVLSIGAIEQSEAKNGVVLALGLALADRGSSVAFTDFDAANSELGSRLGLPDGPTLASVLRRSPPQEDGVKQAGDSSSIDVADMIEWRGMTMLPYGDAPYGSGALADDPRLHSLFEHLSDRHEWVLVNVPAMSTFSDAVRLANHCAGTLIVAQLGKTRFDALRDVSKELTRAGTRIAGVVLIEGAGARRGMDAYELQPAID